MTVLELDGAVCRETARLVGGSTATVRRRCFPGVGDDWKGVCPPGSLFEAGHGDPSHDVAL